MFEKSIVISYVYSWKVLDISLDLLMETDISWKARTTLSVIMVINLTQNQCSSLAFLVLIVWFVCFAIRPIILIKISSYRCFSNFSDNLKIIIIFIKRIFYISIYISNNKRILFKIVSRPNFSSSETLIYKITTKSTP